MLPPPTEDEKRILQVVDEEGVIRGSVLRRRARIEAPAMLQAVRNLVEQQYIAVSGSIADERAMQEAYFSPVPSTRGWVKQAVTRK
jgi:hypothetical protein